MMLLLLSAHLVICRSRYFSHVSSSHFSHPVQLAWPNQHPSHPAVTLTLPCTQWRCLPSTSVPQSPGKSPTAATTRAAHLRVCPVWGVLGCREPFPHCQHKHNPLKVKQHEQRGAFPLPELLPAPLFLGVEHPPVGYRSLCLKILLICVS